MTAQAATGMRAAASPMNYTGGKAKLLPQILPLFPSDTAVFYDVFAGGGNVSANIRAEEIKANDANPYVTGVLECFYRRDTEELLGEIDGIVSRYGLSKTNRDGFLRLRGDYNAAPCPVKLYVLVCHSFNYQFRFNAKHEYNNPFGADKSWFSPQLRDRFIRFAAELKKRNIVFSHQDFRDFLSAQSFGAGDFVYLDPPYLITTGSYNDGKRGFGGWTEREEADLLTLLRRLDKQGVKWALSNVFRHKGKTNDLLSEFAKDFHVHELAPINKALKRPVREEVLICNYTPV